MLKLYYLCSTDAIVISIKPRPNDLVYKYVYIYVEHDNKTILLCMMKCTPSQKTPAFAITLKKII
jgi:hypothetical protein